MKKLGVLLFVLFMGLSLVAQNKKMTLKGECSPVRNGEKLYLRMGNVLRDSVVIENGKFSFTLKGIEPDEAMLYRVNKEGKRECVLLYLDYCDTYIKLTEKTYTTFNTVFIECSVSGNPTDTAVREINNIVFESNNPIADTILLAKLTAVIERHDMAFAYVMWKYGSYMDRYADLLTKVKESWEKVPLEVKQSVAGKKLQEKLAHYMSITIGAVAPDFTLNTPEGKTISLHEYVKGKKLVLIDFWASWCGPCRKEGENVAAIYKDYHDKGFDVLGVSLDNKLEAWKKAIEEDGITWEQVSDLKGWKTPLAKLYDFGGIPYMVLVDGNGRIVAKELRGEALRAKVAEICNK